MARTVTPMLMFEGSAEEAMELYVSVFPNSEITHVVRYGPDEQGKEGTIMRAEFVVGGQRFFCMDSSVQHAFSFTPSMSIFVECETEVELDAAFEQLSTGGGVLMPLANYGFSKKFAWVNDRFGVSWQLNLE